MNRETNENSLNANLENGISIDESIENAFSDLISQYFEDGDNIQNAGTIEQGPVLDWNCVENGQLSTNNEQNLNSQNQTQENSTEKITGVYGIKLSDGINIEENSSNNSGVLYNELTNTNGQEATNSNVYGVIKTDTELLKGINNNEGIVNNETANTINRQETSFKLTQGNLPAKIGFWTKVRNFFIPSSKISYSVQQTTQNDPGLWNKLQNFFSFGNK